ncbi:MAG: AAA family ATPase [SAR324 cluster bacterium]|nr:AAA family ATPase [SAR324 cluster bacterium]
MKIDKHEDHPPAFPETHLMPAPKPPIGISDFKKLRETKGLYYVDKSLFIRDVLEKPAEVILLPRPRRFGKTLNLSMLRYFLEKTPESHAPLFHGLAIEHYPELMARQGQYPVVFLTFKDVKESSWDACLQKLGQLLSALYRQYWEAAHAQLAPEEKAVYERVLHKTSLPGELETALAALMQLLRRATGQKVFLLIDEYDAPIHAGFQHGYYDNVILFMRNLLSAALKDNIDLEKGVMTGILRVAKESIFSGLNNPGVYSLLNEDFSSYFGFTEPEIEQIVTDFSVEQPQALRDWYNGYVFGRQVIYNPWSILNFLDRSERQFQPFWVNTSANELVRDLITLSDSDLQHQVETLLAGGTIFAPLDDNIVLRDIEQSHNTIWNFLTFSGYLKPVNRLEQELTPLYELGIPNREVQYFFHTSIQHWLSRQIGERRLHPLLQALLNADVETFEDVLREMVLETLSFHDTAGQEPEKVYHAFVLGMLVNLSETHRVRSNRESGYGRYDVMLLPKDPHKTGFVLEFKKINRHREETGESAMASALKQIQDKHYATELRVAGIQNIIGIGVVVEGKKVWVESLDL